MAALDATKSNNEMRDKVKGHWPGDTPTDPPHSHAHQDQERSQHDKQLKLHKRGKIGRNNFYLGPSAPFYNLPFLFELGRGK